MKQYESDKERSKRRRADEVNKHKRNRIYLGARHEEKNIFYSI